MLPGKSPYGKQRLWRKPKQSLIATRARPFPLWVKGGHAEHVAAATGSPQKAALLDDGRHLRYGPTRDLQWSGGVRQVGVEALAVEFLARIQRAGGPSGRK
jgi:hypothetical protein